MSQSEPPNRNPKLVKRAKNIWTLASLISSLAAKPSSEILRHNKRSSDLIWVPASRVDWQNNFVFSLREHLSIVAREAWRLSFKAPEDKWAVVDGAEQF